jgi:hypothetical protein
VVLLFLSEIRRRQAVLCATHNGLLATALLGGADGKLDKEQKRTAVEGVIESYCRNEMSDQKSAMVIFEIQRKFEALNLNDDERAFIESVENKWSGKELGFPDAW